MMTKEEYIEKLNREREKITKDIICTIKNYIEMFDENGPIVESYCLTSYEAAYFIEKEAINELEKEYPFLSFTVSSPILSELTTIKWSLK